MCGIGTTTSSVNVVVEVDNDNDIDGYARVNDRYWWWWEREHDVVAVNDETLVITATINTTPIALATIMDMASLIILLNWVYVRIRTSKYMLWSDIADATAARVDDGVSAWRLRDIMRFRAEYSKKAFSHLIVGVGLKHWQSLLAKYYSIWEDSVVLDSRRNSDSAHRQQVVKH